MQNLKQLCISFFCMADNRATVTALQNEARGGQEAIICYCFTFIRDEGTS